MCHVSLLFNVYMVKLLGSENEDGKNENFLTSCTLMTWYLYGELEKDCDHDYRSVP